MAARKPRLVDENEKKRQTMYTKQNERNVLPLSAVPNTYKTADERARPENKR